MLKEASQDEIQAYVKSAVDRMVEQGKTQEEAELAVSQVLTKRAEELGLLSPEEEVTPQDIVIGTAYQALLDKGMDEKTAEAKLVKYLEQA